MIVSQVVLFAVLLLKEAFIPAILLLPLIFISIIFDIYLKRRHYFVTQYLPMGECAKADEQNHGTGCDWLKDAYLQPALKEKAVYPENLSSNGSGLGLLASLLD